MDVVVGELCSVASPTFPNGDMVIANVTLPLALLAKSEHALAGIRPRYDVSDEGLARADILLLDGKISAIRASSTENIAGVARFDADGGMLLPTFVDIHTHLDKGHIWPRAPNPDGTFLSALTATAADRAVRWGAEDVERRMDFALRCAYAHGTSAIRTHLDSVPPQETVSWPLFEEIRSRWADRIDLEAVCLVPIDAFADHTLLERLADRVLHAGGVLGAVTFMAPRLSDLLDSVFHAATARGLDLDFHVDETLDPKARSLRSIAEAAMRNRFSGKILCGHCCALSVQSPDEVSSTLDIVAEAGIAVVSLPACNMYLQDRQAGRTPRRRGVTLVHEMKARGIAVMIASDNVRDPFYAYGDLDMMEIFADATRTLQLNHPYGDWIRAATRTPADIMRRPQAGRLMEGGKADLVLFRARNWSELLARPKAPRMVMRAGRAIDTALPDYRELDDKMELMT